VTTALSPGYSTFIRDGCVAESKAAAGRCAMANPVVKLGTVGSGRDFGKLAAALQNVR